jgi:hypothetical protein
MNQYKKSQPDYAMIAAARAKAQGIDYGWDDIETAIDSVLEDGIRHLDYRTPGMQQNTWMRVNWWTLDESDVPLFEELIHVHEFSEPSPRLAWKQAIDALKWPILAQPHERGTS